ncbi:MAG: pyridoxamine 5'-phosphate oxidase family protein [Clostridiales bacterium]|nr:pyridoxamine 5'-phosphate oxidase family protein [Clostridiales bacterium]
MSRVVDDQEQIIIALKLLIDKYSPEYKTSGNDYMKKYIEKSAVSVIKMEIEYITGKERKAKGD